MKKFLLFMLAFAFIITAVSAMAADTVTVELDGKLIDCKNEQGVEVPPMLIDGTTYLPVRAISNALNFTVEWHDETKSVFINGTPEKPEKGDSVNIYLAGVKFVALDEAGNAVTPLLKGGTTYLPVRAISAAFGKTVEWDGDTKTVILQTPSLPLEIDEAKTYAFVNKANGKAISLTDKGLVLEDFYNYNYQGFKLTKSDTDGYYYINSVTNNKNFDVNGNSKNPGAAIITYNAGTADNQKFKIEKTSEGYLIYALSSLLPIEDSAGTLKQNEKRDSLVQRWDVIEFSPVEKSDTSIYYTLTAHTFALSDSDDANNLWSLTPNEDGEYIITNKSTSKSLDVANNSKTSGDPVITYDTSGDANQRWTFEKVSDGTYLIKSVHSSLYLSVKDGKLIHAELNEAYKQGWTLAPVEK